MWSCISYIIYHLGTKKHLAQQKWNNCRLTTRSGGDCGFLKFYVSSSPPQKLVHTCGASPGVVQPADRKFQQPSWCRPGQAFTCPSASALSSLASRSTAAHVMFNTLYVEWVAKNGLSPDYDLPSVKPRPVARALQSASPSSCIMGNFPKSQQLIQLLLGWQDQDRVVNK